MISACLKFLLILSFLSGTAFSESRSAKSRKKVAKAAAAEQDDNLSLGVIEDADLRAAWDREKKTRWTTPGMGISAQSGFGADWGTLYAGATFASRTLFPKAIADGAVFVGMGFGDSINLIGLEVNYAVTDLDPFLKDSVMAGKLHRSLGYGFAVAVGLENALVFGEGILDVQTAYLALSKVFYLKSSESAWFNSVLLNAGVGNGRFRDFEAQLGGPSGVGVFGSAGIRVNSVIGVSLGWSGYSLDGGLSFAPFRSFRTTINLGYRNIMTNYGPGLPRVFDLSIVYADSFKESTFPFFSSRVNR